MYIVIFITCKNKKEAENIADQLLKDKLIACANIISDIQSMYWWEGRVNSDQEVMMVIKTRKTLFSKIVKAVKAIHSYKVPEIIAMPIISGNKDYLNWIDDSTKGRKNDKK
ncbi:MAG: divalent-cation tolerance protein CutA [Candidatus Omnitrophica bacterium]|nr:divalent-cation tolerance protein CutA [Candidatus Omnitrophota bacterium]